MSHAWSERIGLLRDVAWRLWRPFDILQVQIPELEFLRLRLLDNDLVCRQVVEIGHSPLASIFDLRDGPSATFNRRIGIHIRVHLTHVHVILGIQKLLIIDQPNILILSWSILIIFMIIIDGLLLWGRVEIERFVLVFDPVGTLHTRFLFQAWQFSTQVYFGHIESTCGGFHGNVGDKSGGNVHWILVLGRRLVVFFITTIV